jgi:hypothetical protein
VSSPAAAPKRLTAAAVARALGISASSVRRCSDRGELPCDRVLSGERRYDPAAVTAFARLRRLPLPPWAAGSDDGFTGGAGI